MTRILLLALYILLLLQLIPSVTPFHHADFQRRKTTSIYAHSSSRREFLNGGGRALFTSMLTFPFLTSPLSSGVAAAADVASSSLSDLTGLLKESRKQLEAVPALIKDQKWDSVRAILITPPLCDCWAKTNRPLLQTYADVLGDRGGDELAALEGKEDLISHLRYLDMAVYNNVFNPIATEGETGATKELVRSYYEDPINEYKAVDKALGDLLELSDGL